MSHWLFSQIVGQELAKKVLKKAIVEKRVPHAYLFFGIPGIGKTTTARVFAMALNCEKEGSVEGCGRCAACRRMKSDNSPDFHVVQPDGQNIRIDQIRELNHHLAFAPALGRYRIWVIQKAESMTVEAANAFLKTLEEPPRGNVFVLNASEPLNLLPTILSRCQKIPFHPLPTKELIEALEVHKNLDREKASIVARVSDGSLGRAFKMAEGGYLDRRQEWLLALIKLPSLGPREALALALESVAGYARTSFDADESDEPGLPDFLGIWESWYRDLLVLSVHGDSNLITNMDFSKELKGMVASFTIERLTGSIFLLDLAQRDLRRNCNPALVLEHTLLYLRRLCS